MKMTYRKSVIFFCGLSLVLIAAGCNLVGCHSEPRFKHTRTIQLSAAFAPGSMFGAETHNGSITVTGDEVRDCNLTATIVAQAHTAEEAQELAEKVDIALVPSAGKLEVKITKPDTSGSRSISVNLEAILANQANLHLVTHNGAVKTSGITGDIDGTTHNGSITADGTTGQLKLETHNGKITCSEISGGTFAKTHNGSVDVSYLKTAPSPSNISLTTYNGSINLDTPPNLSAKVVASTHNGSIKTDLPITVTGEVGKTRLQGTIGTGEGKLELETYNGSIRIE